MGDFYHESWRFPYGQPLFFHQQSGIFHEIDNPAIGLASFQETSIWEHMI
jgi:hypothetical protein